MPKLNAKESNELSVRSAVVDWYATHSYGPSFRDLASSTGLSLGTVYNVCRDLRESGVIEYIDGVARTLRLVAKG